MKKPKRVRRTTELTFQMPMQMVHWIMAVANKAGVDMSDVVNVVLAIKIVAERAAETQKPTP